MLDWSIRSNETASEEWWVYMDDFSIHIQRFWCWVSCQWWRARINKPKKTNRWVESLHIKKRGNWSIRNKQKETFERETYLDPIFYIGINLEGYWNYNHIALQVEDVFDILSIMFPGYDFRFLLDQSTGHGRQRQGPLNTNLMNKNFGGKQSKLRNTKTKD